MKSPHDSRPKLTEPLTIGPHTSGRFENVLDFGYLETSHGS
jgi:hypothetical protein